MSLFKPLSCLTQMLSGFENSVDPDEVTSDQKICRSFSIPFVSVNLFKNVCDDWHEYNIACWSVYFFLFFFSL